MATKQTHAADAADAAVALRTEWRTDERWAGIKRAFGTPSALTMAMLGFGSGLPFLLIASQTLSRACVTSAWTWAASV